MTCSDLGIDLIPLNSADPDPVTLSTPVLQPKGCLNLSTSVAFQQSLEQAFQQATHMVIVDLLWVDEITPEALVILKQGIQRALQLGKEIVFLSPGKDVYALVMAETMKQRSLQLGKPSIQCQPEFRNFLNHPKFLPKTVRYNSTERPRLEKFYQKPRKASSVPVLSGALYHDAVWANSQQAS